MTCSTLQDKQNIYKCPLSLLNTFDNTLYVYIEIYFIKQFAVATNECFNTVLLVGGIEGNIYAYFLFDH